MGRPRNWVTVASAEHARRGRDHEPLGFMQVGHGKRAPLARIAPGDRVAYYAPATTLGGKDKLQSFVSIGVVQPGEPYEFDMGEHSTARLPLRVLRHLSRRGLRPPWGGPAAAEAHPLAARRALSAGTGRTDRAAAGCLRIHRGPKTQRIGVLWGRFFSEGIAGTTPGRTGDARIFGVYSNYESDAQGPFDLTVGVVVEPRADAVSIGAGACLVFRGTGPMPHTVLATWQRIWQYFEEHPRIERRFAQDFEAYEGADAVAIHIGVK